MKKNIGTILILSLTLVALTIATPLLAASVYAQNVAQSYIADAPLQPGMIVELATDKTRVKPVSQSNASKMLGIVVQPNDAPLSLSQEGAGQNVYVSTSGSYHALVSDQNGPIVKGDYLIVSSLDGIGMKANSNAEYVIGKALDNFDGKTSVLTSTQVKDDKGATHTVNFGYATTDINISRNPLLKVGSTTSSSVPSILQKASDSVANKPVTPVRVYAALAVLILIAIIVCVILYSAIRTSITALGRNPLARKSIYRNLVSVVLIAIIVLIIGLFAVYLLLKL